MLSVRRFALLFGLVGLTLISLANDGMAETKFASDEVAAAARTPNVADAVAAMGEMEAAFAAQDADAVAALFAEDLIVNTPANRVANKQDVIGYLKSGRIDYEDATTTIDGLSTRIDHVVIMGEQVLKPQGATDNVGKTVRRRFTDVWRKEPDGKWRLTIRQATITSVE